MKAKTDLGPFTNAASISQVMQVSYSMYIRNWNLLPELLQKMCAVTIYVLKLQLPSVKKIIGNEKHDLCAGW